MQLHPGDLGWHWRFGPEATAAAVRTWSRERQILAVGLVDRPGLVRLAREERIGPRPPRRMDSVTGSGERRFLELLRPLLGPARDGGPSSDVALMFLDRLPADEALRCSRGRLAAAVEDARRLARTPSHGAQSAVDLAVWHMRACQEAEVACLRRLVARLDSAAAAPTHSGPEVAP
jgi:hypothetical protein